MLKVGDNVSYNGDVGKVIEVGSHEWLGEKIPDATVNFGWKISTIDQEYLVKK